MRAYLPRDVGLVCDLETDELFVTMCGTVEYKSRWASCDENVKFLDGAVLHADGTATIYGPAPTDTSIMTETGWQEAV